MGHMRQQSPVSPPRAFSSCPVILMLTAHILDMVTTWPGHYMGTVLVTVTDAADDDMTTVAYL